MFPIKLATPSPAPAAETTSVRPSPSGKKGLPAGIVLFVACAAACSLPLLVAGGAAVIAGLLATGADTIAGVLLAAAALVGAGLWLRHRRAQNAADSCGCGGNCGR